MADNPSKSHNIDDQSSSSRSGHKCHHVEPENRRGCETFTEVFHELKGSFTEWQKRQWPTPLLNEQGVQMVVDKDLLGQSRYDTDKDLVSNVLIPLLLNNCWTAEECDIESDRRELQSMAGTAEYVSNRGKSLQSEYSGFVHQAFPTGRAILAYRATIRDAGMTEEGGETRPSLPNEEDGPHSMNQQVMGDTSGSSAASSTPSIVLPPSSTSLC